jgi:hypothetical protein
VRGSLLVASVTALSLAAVSGVIAQLAWEAGESRRVRSSADALAEGIWTEAQRENTSLDLAAADALQESGLAGDRLELWRRGRLIAAHPPGSALGPAPLSPEVLRDWIVASRSVGADGFLVVAAPRSTGFVPFGSSFSRWWWRLPLLTLAWGVGKAVSTKVTRPLADFRDRVLAAHPDRPFPRLPRSLSRPRSSTSTTRSASYGSGSEGPSRRSRTSAPTPLTSCARHSPACACASSEPPGWGPSTRDDLARGTRVDRMVRLVDTLLVLSATPGGLPGEVVNLADLVRQSVSGLLPGTGAVRLDAPDE